MFTSRSLRAGAVVIAITLVSAVYPTVTASAVQSATGFPSSCFFTSFPPFGNYAGSGSVTVMPDGHVNATCKAELVSGEPIVESTRLHNVDIFFDEYEPGLISPCQVRYTPSGHANAVCHTRQ